MRHLKEKDRDKKNICKGKIDLVFLIVLKIHLQFPQFLPKTLDQFPWSLSDFFAKIISACDERVILEL